MAAFTESTKTKNNASTENALLYADAEINKQLSADKKIDLLRQMIRIRRFEEQSLKAYQQGNIGGFLHLYIGQEAVATGTLSICGKNDHIITAYRDHGHALMVGMSMKECMAELYGKYTGCSKGKGGSMHFFAPDKNYWGGHGIVGGQTPLGLGIAFALKYKGQTGSCLCFLGDGAVNQGPFHEALNIASLWDIPVVFIIENNNYSMGTSQERSSAYRDCLAKRAEGYNMDWDIGNGHILYEVRAKTAEAIKRAHEKNRPTLLELETYRYRGHSVADPDKTYRTKEEIQKYRETKDPITIFQNVLIQEGVINEAQIKEINQAAKDEAKAASEFSEESPFPPVEEITRDVYWEADHPQERVSRGTLFFEEIKS